MRKLASTCVVLLLISFLVFAAHVPIAKGKPQGVTNYAFQNNTGKFYDLLINSSSDISFKLTGPNQQMLGVGNNVTNGLTYVISRLKTKNYKDMRDQVFAAAQNDKLNLWVQCLPQANGSNAAVDYLVLSPGLP